VTSVNADNRTLSQYAMLVLREHVEKVDEAKKAGRRKR
jgi:hypothetical protein